MSDNDYYKLLGLNKSASDDQIKKAYRKLAMKYHPDQTQGDKAAEEKFKKISEAYAVLSDKEKRNQYDTYGSTDFHQKFSQDDIFRNFDFGNIFRDLGFGGGSFFGGGRQFSFNGGGSPFGAQSRGQSHVPKGSDLVYEMPLTLRDISTGASKTINFNHKGKSEHLTVKIPKGMIDGKKIRLQGKGEDSPHGGPPGDLFIKSKIMPDPQFWSEEYDLHINREIKLTEAILGTNIKVPTIEGKELSLKVPPGTRHKTKMRLPGHGLSHMQGNQKGNLYVYIVVKYPDKLTDEQRKLVKELEKTGI